MSNIPCLSCFQKHLASAFSFGSEVIGGHSAGGNPDHRVDFSGELINAEKHALVLSQPMALKVRALRRKLQSQRFKPEQSDLDSIKTIWFASFAVIGGHEAVSEIAKVDVDLAAMIAVKLHEYNLLDMTKESSDVSRDCNCKAASKTTVGIGGKPSFKVKVYTFGIDEDKRRKLEFNLKKFLVGFDSLSVLPDPIEFFPSNLPDDDESIYVFWPSNVELIKTIDVYNLPAVADTASFFDKFSAKFINSNCNVLHSKKTYKLPMQVFPAVAAKICNDFLMTTGRDKFEDFYSIYRAFSTDNVFSPECKIFVKPGEERNGLTLYEVTD